MFSGKRHNEKRRRFVYPAFEPALPRDFGQYFRSNGLDCWASNALHGKRERSQGPDTGRFERFKEIKNAALPLLEVPRFLYLKFIGF